MSKETAVLPAQPLHYRLRWREWWLFHCLNQFCSPLTQGVLLLCAATWGHWVWAEGSGLPWALAAALVAWLAFWLLQWGFNAACLWGRRSGALLGMHTVTVSAEGLRDSTEVYDHLLRWPGVVRVVNYGVVVAVYRSAVDAVVLPRSAFADSAAQQAWSLQLHERVSAFKRPV